VTSAPGGPTRLLALYALRGLDRLTPAQVARALADADPGVREHGVTLAEAFVQDEDLRRQVLALATDPSPRVRYQLAFTVGALPFDDEVLAAMETLLGRDGDDVWMRTAALTTLSHPVVPILQRLAAMPGWSASPGGSAFLGHVLTTIGARGQPAEMAAAVALLAGTSDEHARLTLARDFFAGLSRGDVPLPRADPDGRLAPTLEAASRRAADRATDERVRVTALQLLAQDPRVSHEPFLSVVGPAEPQQVQTTAIAALRRRDAPAIAPALLARWGALTPRVRQDALGLLLARPDRALALLHAVRAGTVQRADLSAGQAQSLLSHADPRVSTLADEVLERAVADRVQVVHSYRPALGMHGDATRGRAVFAEACAACHRLDDVGVDIGPNLLGVQHHGREGLLIAILDPNRKVDPAYLFYEVETRAGDTLQGAITAESPGALTVTQAFGRTQVVPRDQILQMRSLGTSMMPEGLEATLTHGQMADLLEFLITR
jgi:putative heme-binding domain-containing protein